jgi:hypothetical protein
LIVLAFGALMLPLTGVAAQGNNPPGAVNDTVSTSVNSSVTFNVVSNDVDMDGNLDVTTAAAVTLPLNGTLINHGSGLFNYTPNTGFTGTDSFNYQVCDTTALCAIATVAITVTADGILNAVDDAISTPEDTPVRIDVIANDLDADNNIEPATVTVTTAPINGTAVSNGDGTVTYTPAVHFFGSDSFTYNVCDADGLCDSAEVTIDVTSVNDLPDCSAVSPSIERIWPANHKMVSVNVLGATDTDNDPIRIVITSITSDEPDNGIADGNTPGDTAGVGTDTAQVRAERSGNGDGRVYQISFTADDGQDGTCSNTVSVFVPHDQSDVIPVELAPVPEEAPARPGDFGCDRPGNSCNAPGHNKADDDDDSGNGRGNGNGNGKK